MTHTERQLRQELEEVWAMLRAERASQQPAASGEPVAWHMRVIGCDGSADWCELGAGRPETQPGIEALPLVYATAQPAPAPAAQGCACFPGTCRGGEVINGRLANGQVCAAAAAGGA